MTRIYLRNYFSHSWGNFGFLAGISLILPSFSLTFPFSSSSTFFFLLGFLRKILLICLAYNYLTISVNCSRSWGVFSDCDFCHSLDCFGRRCSSHVDSKSVSFSTSLLFVTNTVTTIFKLPFSIEAECKAKLNEETLQSYENTLYFLNSAPASVCLQSQQTATKQVSDRERKAMKLLKSTQANNKCNRAAHPGTTPWSCPVHDTTAKAENREMREYQTSEVFRKGVDPEV